MIVCSFAQEVENYVHTENCTQTFTEVLVVTEFRSNQDVLQEMKRTIKYEPYRQWDIIHHWKDISYQAIKRHRRNLNAYFSVKEFNLKSLYTALFQLYDTLEKTKPVRQ